MASSPIRPMPDEPTCWDVMEALERGEAYPKPPVVIDAREFPAVSRKRGASSPAVTIMIGVVLALTVLYAAAVFMAGRAVALDTDEGGAGPAMTAYPGRCDALTLFGHDASARCALSVATLSLPDGRTGYAFPLVGGGIVNLTAPASRRSTVEGRTILLVDQVNVVAQGQGERIEAAGRCEAGDPPVAGAKIGCKAETARGRVAADFTSAGGPGRALAR